MTYPLSSGGSIRSRQFNLIIPELSQLPHLALKSRNRICEGEKPKRPANSPAFRNNSAPRVRIKYERTAASLLK